MRLNNPDNLVLMRGRCRPGTKWAAYENQALDSSLCGGQALLLVGEGCTYQVPPPGYPSDDTQVGVGWKYRFKGFVDLDTGEIEEPLTIVLAWIQESLDGSRYPRAATWESYITPGESRSSLCKAREYAEKEGGTEFFRFYEFFYSHSDPLEEARGMVEEEYRAGSILPRPRDKRKEMPK